MLSRSTASWFSTSLLGAFEPSFRKKPEQRKIEKYHALGGKMTKHFRLLAHFTLPGAWISSSRAQCRLGWSMVSWYCRPVSGHRKGPDAASSTAGDRKKKWPFTFLCDPVSSMPLWSNQSLLGCLRVFHFDVISRKCSCDRFRPSMKRDRLSLSFSHL